MLITGIIHQVGLLLALLCAKQQLSVRIFERQPVRYPLGRAAAIDHESVRLLGAAGLQSKLDELLQDVIHESPGKTFAWRDAEGESASWMRRRHSRSS